MSVFTKCYNVRRRMARVSFIARVYSTQGDFMKSMHPDVQIPKVNLAEYIMKDFGKFHDKIAIECGITGKKYKYEEVRKNSISLSKSLRKVFQLKKGDVLAIFLSNNPDYPTCILGAIQAGSTVTTINPSYTAEELERHLKDSNAKVLITVQSYLDIVKTALRRMNVTIPIVIIKTQPGESIPADTINFNELIDMKSDLPDMVPVEGDHVILLPYSSGTTGLPKGVMLTNDNLVANIMVTNQPEIQYAHETTESHQDVLHVILPMYHLYGLSICTLEQLLIGCKLITLPKFTPDTFLQAMARCTPTQMQLVPPLVLFLLTHAGMKAEYFERLRVVLCGAAPLGGLDEQRFRDFVGKPIQIIQAYGMTEASPTTHLLPQKCEGRYSGSFGHPIHNTLVKVVAVDDPTFKHLGPNQNGEILIKGPQIMKGYHNKPEETKAAFVDGWYRTGDIARYDEDEMFYIADRLKELIKVKGFQVAPAELEEVIRSFPGVAEAAVVGIPHQYHGESPRAYIVEKVGCKVDTERLAEYVRAKVSPYKKLTGGVAVIDSIPKNPSGKILRRSLRLQYEQKGI